MQAPLRSISSAPGAIQGTAPYLRAAYMKDFGDKNVQVGGFYMAANLLPGLDNSTGMTDHYQDFGVDGSFQLFAAQHLDGQRCLLYVLLASFGSDDDFAQFCAGGQRHRPVELRNQRRCNHAYATGRVATCIHVSYPRTND